MANFLIIPTRGFRGKACWLSWGVLLSEGEELADTETANYYYLPTREIIYVNFCPSDSLLRQLVPAVNPPTPGLQNCKTDL